MDEQDSYSYSAPVLYFLVGGIVGAGAALLLAPQSGRETREQLGQKLRDGADSARHMKDELIQKTEQMKDGLAHKTEQVKQGAVKLRDRAVTAFSGAAQSAEELS